MSAVAFTVDTAALRTLASELGGLAADAGADTSGAVVTGPPSPAHAGAQAYLDRHFHLSAGSAGLNVLFADVSTYVSGRAADFGAHLRTLQLALTQSATNLQAMAALYESVNEEQRAALDGIAAAFGEPSRRSASLAADGYQPQCVRVPLALMTAAPTSTTPGGEYGLVHSILTTDWTSPSALVLQAIGECFKEDPLAFITVRFGGDWARVDTAAQAADALAWCFSSIGDNIADASRGCAELWTGSAADAAFEYLDRLARAARAVGEVADGVSKALHRVASAMFEACEEVAGLFSTAMDCIGAAIVNAGLGGATATTVVGPALAALIDALLLSKAVHAAHEALKKTRSAITRIEAIVELLAGRAAYGSVGATSVTIPLSGGAR